jgi:hypothetical protein
MVGYRYCHLFNSRLRSHPRQMTTPSSPPMRRISRPRHTQIQMQSRQLRSVAIPIRGIRLRARRRYLLPPRRLRILPHHRPRSPTRLQRRRLHPAPIRRRTSILIHPHRNLLLEVPTRHPRPNILSRRNLRAAALIYRLPTRIHPRPIPSAAHLLRPSPQILRLLGQ